MLKATPRPMRHAHLPGMKVKAVFSEENGLRYRYLLEIAKRGEPRNLTACVVMQNPSYACVEWADKSVQFMEKIVFEKNLPAMKDVSRMIVVNQFARIQTNDFEGQPFEIGSKNDAAIRKALKKSEIIILAWGCANPFEERKAFVLGELQKLKGKKLFMTRSHPSRARYDGFLQPFDLHH